MGGVSTNDTCIALDPADPSHKAWRVVGSPRPSVLNPRLDLDHLPDELSSLLRLAPASPYAEQSYRLKVSSVEPGCRALPGESKATIAGRLNRRATGVLFGVV